MAEEFLPLNEAERDSDTSWYTSLAAGIASGIIKIPEGVVSLAAELIDLGAETRDLSLMTLPLTLTLQQMLKDFLIN
mgnify:CR=1 FL=1